MNTARLVDQVRTSRGLRQQAEKALMSVREASDDAQKNRLLLAVVTLQNQAIAALEQAMMSAAE